MTQHRHARPGAAAAYRPVLAVAAGIAALLLLAACGGTGQPGWTYAPVTAAPSAAGSPAASGGVVVASPAASGSPAASAAPTTSASGAPSSTAPGSPAASGSTGSNAPGSPTAPGQTPASSAAAGTTIELEETEELSLLQNGQPVTQLNVHVGETIVFKIDNTADFEHTFFIGPANDLANDQRTGLTGLSDFNTGTQEFTYTVTADTANLQFGCSLDGHYPTMHGMFVVTP